MNDYSKELEIAKQAARKGSEIIIQYTTDKDFDIELKGKNDLVTDADLATEKVVLKIIQEAFPEDQVMAEESQEERRVPEARTWLVDPIDGTTNFAHGFPIYCVSVAMWEHREPKVGVVLEVGRDELFSAVKGQGAYLNGSPIHVSKTTDPANTLIGTGFPYRDLYLVKHYLELFEYLMHNTHGVRRPGSAAFDMCCVAAGRYDGFYEYSLNAWDVAAASLIIKEAGGVLSDWEGGDNWLFGKRILAGNEAIHSFLLKAVEEHFTSEERKAEQA
ncbi:inositol monophosphatase [Aliifodinibius sp. S!AR15-10]|uniref:inositol monophosphatase family protein n=1 Tax=Aliifodinibius sp. S!AR15-10 TaxID=2950437 RepID=UPI002864FDC7|nr:inositol monophosphatase family protein [Aliifodinibius sp. S!AR15-10]MDR8390122.1 inositol monophosphatase [Aliifodinibius sp. S!AR15-10]